MAADGFPLFRAARVLRLPPPIQREPLALAEWIELRRDPVWCLDDVPDMPSQPVALVPGFLAGDASLGPLTDWLRRAGQRTSRAGIRFNVGCSTTAVDGLEERVERLADREGQRVTLIGQSRGGVIARGLAMRRPDLVARLVTLGSPHIDPLAIHPLVYLQVVAVGALGTLGVPGMFGTSCFNGDCCERFRREAFEPYPAGARFVSIYSRTDGVVDWHSCLAPGAELVEVPGTHFGMALNRHVLRVIARELAAPAHADRSVAA